MRPIIYDIVGILLMLGSLVFLYRSIEFLAQKDYVAGGLALIAGVVVVRVGVELGRLSFAERRDSE
jgi:hypothetical protein